MDCPDNLVFNKYLDRCDYNQLQYSPCVTAPCLHGGRCVDLPNFEYKCECLAGFSGEKCENAPDICALNPCGSNGKCHTMPANSPIPFYCTCFNEHMFGLGCSRNVEVNPCTNSDSEEAYFKTKLDPSLFIHCSGKVMHMKFCSRPLVFSSTHNICEWDRHDKLEQSSAKSPQVPVVQRPQVYADVNSAPKNMYQETRINKQARSY